MLPLQVLIVGADDMLRQLTGAEDTAVEPPLSENEPIYFSVGTRGDTTARFQLSFKYRLFDRQFGWGRNWPWLAGLHFAYTQTSIWNLSETSKPFTDTSYRPSLFWQWRRADDKTWVDAARLGSVGVVLAHNHPSGDARPSGADCQATRKLARAGEAIDLAVLDHLIFAGSNCNSMRRMGLL